MTLGFTFGGEIKSLQRKLFHFRSQQIVRIQGEIHPRDRIFIPFEEARAFADHLAEEGISGGIALVVLTEDSEFCARNTRNFLWVTFTRSNPSHDLHGAGSFIEHKHWGCKGPIVIDARIKPHHAPPLVEDPAVSRRVDGLAAVGGPLHGII